MQSIDKCKNSFDNSGKLNIQPINNAPATIRLAFQMNQFKFLLIVGVTLICLYAIPGMVYQAYSDGLFQENLPPATVGDRQASLFTKVSPPVLTSDSHVKRFFEIRLYDAKTGDNITNVNYFITVTKSDKLLMRELFYSKSGPLKIEFIPRLTKESTVF